MIRPNYLSDSYDQQVTIAMFRLMRRWMREPALQGIVGAELLPGPGVEDDTSILHAFRTQGAAGFHAWAPHGWAGMMPSSTRGCACAAYPRCG